MDTANKSNLMDWILFLISTAVLAIIFVVSNEWFWVALPFSLTYLVKALKAM
jgi:hypothetical protein